MDRSSKQPSSLQAKQLLFIMDSIAKNKLPVTPEDQQAIRSATQSVLLKVATVPIMGSVGIYMLLSRVNLPRLTRLRWTSYLQTPLIKWGASVGYFFMTASSIVHTLPNTVMSRMATLQTPLGMTTRGVMEGRMQIIGNTNAGQFDDPSQISNGEPVYSDDFPNQDDQENSSSGPRPHRRTPVGNRDSKSVSTGPDRRTRETDAMREEEQVESTFSSSDFDSSESSSSSSSLWRDDDSSSNVWASRSSDDDWSSSAQISSSSDDDSTISRRDEDQSSLTPDQDTQDNSTSTTNGDNNAVQQPRKATRRRL